MTEKTVIIIDLELCFECGAVAEHMHHVVPQSRGGTRTLPLCGTCHSLIHDSGVSSSQLVKEGLARHRESGGHSGSLPYGMTYTDQVDGQGHRIVAAVPVELLILDMMRTLRGQGSTYGEIADQLNELKHRNRQGGLWTKANVGRILRRLASEQEQH